MVDDEQSSLIAVMKRRDHSGWSAAIDRHSHELYGFVFHLVGGDRAVAEDLNQETWLEAMDGIDQCDAARGSFRNWLFGIARNRIAKFAVAATVLVASGILVSWIVIGGSTNIAFADVAMALESLRSATYDCTMEEGKNPLDGKTTTTTMKCFFLAPSRERNEVSMSMGSAKDKGSSIMILDHQAKKGLVLAPEQKLATTMDLSKIKKPAGPSNLFEMVRQLVREGSNSPGEKVESLGKKEIDGRMAVGFRTHSNMADQTFWADPETARLVRVDIDMPGAGIHGGMSNFRYMINRKHC